MFAEMTRSGTADGTVRMGTPAPSAPTCSSRRARFTTAGARKTLRRAYRRAALNAHVTPHAFRNKAAAALNEATELNAEMVAQEFGWEVQIS
jgi:integrase